MTIFHYHFQPGGVTTVVGLCLDAICTYLPEITKITIVAGRVDGADAFFRRFEEPAARSGVTLQLRIDPALDYFAANADTLNSPPGSGELCRNLIRAYGGSTWWIHNYHLGKNPYFTQALLEIASLHPDQRLVFHIHDFPECSRYGNLNLLDGLIDRPMYPVSNNVRYAVINGRDRRILLDAGLPDAAVYLLPNPSNAGRIERSDATRTKTLLVQTFGDEFPSFAPSLPILIYPVRAIRRKNVLELGLISAASPFPVNLVVTLPGTSVAEKPYSQKVERCFKDGLIPGLFGIGRRIESLGIGFESLIGSADVVVSSSVQEGFGLLFLDAIRWGLPIFARRIDVLVGMNEITEGPSIGLYDEFLVPVDATERARLLALYKVYLEKLTADIADDIGRRVYAEIEELFRARWIDSSYLDVEAQIALLKRVRKNTSVGVEISERNADLYRRAEMLIERSPSVSPGTVGSQFTIKGYADYIKTVIRSFGKTSFGRREQNAVAETKIRAAFAHKEFMRLIFQ